MPLSYQLAKYKYDVLLAFTFCIMVVAVHYCYPIPQISWDSHYYIDKSITLHPGIRGIGYSVVLKLLYGIWNSLAFVQWVQYSIYFLSLYSLLCVLRKCLGLKELAFYVLGVLLLLEPAGLYHCFNILSDLLFSTFTYWYIATLLLFTYEKKFIWLLLHAIVMYCAIETRLIAIFYPFFSILVFLFFGGNYFLRAFSVITMLAVYFFVVDFNVKRNKKFYGVGVHTAFQGWTLANNALYALPRIHYDAKHIADPQLRDLHQFFTSYRDTASFVVFDVGSGYMWDPKSPLNVIAEQVTDSLRIAAPENLTFNKVMYATAERFERYGLFIQKNFPYEFFMGFIVPNMHWMISPHDGEMSDYYAYPRMEQSSLDHYGVKLEDFYCRIPIYKNYINAINLKIYHVRLLSFALCIAGGIYYRKKINRKVLLFLGVSISFIAIFYMLMLYSSWFMPRYILPVLPLFTAVIYISFLSLVSKSFRQGHN